MIRSVGKWVALAAIGVLSTVGIATLALAAMIATPVKTPPELPSISATGRAIDRSNLPPVVTYQGRDGTYLGYRAYAPAGAPAQSIAVLIHGSSGNGMALNVMARELAKGGVMAIALDMRGHGVSGTRGDIGYIGQLEDDVEDLVAHLKAAYPGLPLALAGHSSGGGFVLRFAADARGNLFDRYVLLAPFLGPFAATSRPQTGAAHWSEPDIPRIIGLTLLHRAGIWCCEQLPALTFATPPNAQMRQTTRYSFRLLANFGTDFAMPTPFAKVTRPMTIVSGTQDELIDSARFADLVKSSGGAATVTLIPDASHMGLLADERAIAAVARAIQP